VSPAFYKSVVWGFAIVTLATLLSYGLAHWTGWNQEKVLRHIYGSIIFILLFELFDDRRWR